MKSIAQFHAVLRVALVLLAMGAGANALAQKPAGPRIILAVNEGGAANSDYLEVVNRYEEFAQMVGTTLKGHVAVVAVRNRDRLQENLKKHSYDLLLARPNDVPALAVRDFGYRAVATAKEPYRTLFIVPKGSALKTIADRL